MKILRLTIAGFGPYKNEQHVDFERFDGDGIFLITGKTGAGKSSILDAICFVLYAGVPRYDGTQQQLRSDHCAVDDPTFVELEFRIDGTDYRVRRSPEYERPKRRGVGMTQEPATAELSVRTGDTWQGIAARAVDVAMELDRVLGLSKDQFLQVILLAQNRFQRFLRASNDERQSVLRTLFGTRRFERVETALAERKKALEVQLTTARASLAGQAERAAALLCTDSVPAAAAAGADQVPAEPDLAWFESGLLEIEGALSRAKAEVARFDAAAADAEACHRALDGARTLQLRRDAATAKLRSLESGRDETDAVRATLLAATRAAAVWPQVNARRAASAAAERAAEAEGRARDACALHGDAEATSGGLKVTVDETTRLLGTLESVLTDEGQLAELEADIEVSRNRVDGCTEAVVRAGARITDLPTVIDDETKRFLDSQVRASAEGSAVERLERVAGALKAATRAVTLDRQHTALLVAEKQASGAHLAATARHDALLEQRLRGHAAELAAQLVDGQPCAVCGSSSHPAPATEDGTPVTGADIESARDEIGARREVMDAASESARSLATALAECRAKSDRKTVVQLEGELMAAESALADAESARTEVGARKSELTRLRGELDTAQADLDALRGAKEDASKQLAELKSTRKGIRARVAKARSTYDSVTTRVGHLLARLDAATALADAITESVACAKAESDANRALAAQLSEHGFADEREVEVARRDVAGIAALEATIRAFEQAVATAKSTLAEEGMSDLPAEPIETDAARAASESAHAARDAARDTRGLLAERTTQLRTVVAAARAQDAASAGLRRDYTQLRELAGAVQGLEPNTRRMRLETYVLAAQLEEIVSAANARLGTMTHGRFALEHDDGVQYRNARSGLGLSILDQHTGRSRATHSLSGGETFLASLALALGLAEVVQNQAGGITLDTLFIDEGFGSLDSETLETAMSTLDGLRAGGRTIGLISHVDTMKEQIPAKLRITVTDQGYSEISASIEPAEHESPAPAMLAAADDLRDLVDVGAP